MGDRERLLGSLALVAVSYAGLRSRRAQGLDRRAGAWIAQPMGTVADRVISAGTDLGSVYAIAGISSMLAASGRRAASLDVAGAGALAWVASQLVKPLVERPRPYEAMELARLVAKPAGASWPSGHVAVAWGMGGALAPRLSPAGRVAAGLLGGLVAVSRVYVGVHYLSDVVAGAGIGVGCGVMWRAARRRVTTMLTEGPPPEGSNAHGSELVSLQSPN